MNEKKEINYLLRCPECNLALFKSRRISKLPIKQGYHCYGCDKDVSFSHSDVELVIERFLYRLRQDGLTRLIGL